MDTSGLFEDVLHGTFLVIPAYNEATRLPGVLADLSARYPHIVVVDDGSEDDTFGVAREATPHVLRHIINRGQGAALQTGFEYALARGARFLVTYDADGQHRAEDVVALLTPLARGECDVTLGSRFLGDTVDMPTVRRITLKLGVLFTRFFSRIPITDTHNGLRGFTRHGAAQIQLRSDRMAHASEILDLIQRVKLTFREVPVRIQYTRYSLAKGQPSHNAIRIAFEYLANRLAR